MLLLLLQATTLALDKVSNFLSTGFRFGSISPGLRLHASSLCAFGFFQLSRLFGIFLGLLFLFRFVTSRPNGIISSFLHLSALFFR